MESNSHLDYALASPNESLLFPRESIYATKWIVGLTEV
jgi:hypothetical protein